MSLYAIKGPLVFPRNDECEMSSPRPLYQVNDSSTYYDFAQAMSKRYHQYQTKNRQPPVPLPSPVPDMDQAKVVIDYSLIQTLSNPRQIIHCCSTDDDGHSSEETHLNNHLKIKVKDGYIDFQKLAHTSVGGRFIKMPLRQHHQQRGSSCCRLYRRHSYNHLNGEYWDLDPHEHAIEFVLSICYIGRSYTAHRSLQRIVQLRKDLIEEHNRNHQLKWSSETASTTTTGEEDGVDSRCSSSFGDWSLDSPPQHNESHVLTASSGDSLNDSVVPDLPCTRWNTTGCGFGRMTAMLQAYRQDLETWFQTILKIVSDDSPVLADFLWEPLSTESLDELHESVSKLSSIQESYGDLES